MEGQPKSVVAQVDKSAARSRSIGWICIMTSLIASLAVADVRVRVSGRISQPLGQGPRYDERSTGKGKG